VCGEFGKENIKLWTGSKQENGGGGGRRGYDNKRGDGEAGYLTNEDFIKERKKRDSIGFPLSLRKENSRGRAIGAADLCGGAGGRR